MSIRIQTEDFDIAQEIAALRSRNPSLGAIVSFIGAVRDMTDGERVTSMAIEHYPAMTEKSIAAIVDQTQARWQITDATVIHRVGQLAAGDQIVLVVVVSAHRGDAFAACEFIMDFLKTRAPFWKKEHTASTAHWVDARESDDHAAGRWRST